MAQGRNAPPTRRAAKPFYDLDGFARLFLATHSVRRHDDIRTEFLAEAFRQLFELSAFPTLDDLVEVCGALGIVVDELPSGPDDLLGANISHGTAAAIFLKADLSTRRAETTLGHELREVIENALKRASRRYVGLDTVDNRAMHHESEQFAACLLMQGRASHEHLQQMGYDVVRFAAERERSLPSVIMRAQALYRAGGPYAGPAAGLWLFEAPWHRVQARTATPDALAVRYQASLCGFSTDKRRSASSKLANFVLPGKGRKAADFGPAAETIEHGAPVLKSLPYFDLFGEHNYIVAAEPLFLRDEIPWRVLVTAVRRDCLNMVGPWLDRLAVPLPTDH